MRVGRASRYSQIRQVIGVNELGLYRFDEALRGMILRVFQVRLDLKNYDLAVWRSRLHLPILPNAIEHSVYYQNLPELLPPKLMSHPEDHSTSLAKIFTVGELITRCGIRCPRVVGMKHVGIASR